MPDEEYRHERGDAAGRALDRFWEGMVRGEGPAPDADLDPGTAATVRRLHAHDDTPGANPAFANRLLEDLMGSSVSSNTVTLRPDLGSFVPNGRAAPAWHLPALPLPARKRR